VAPTAIASAERVARGVLEDLDAIRAENTDVLGDRITLYRRPPPDEFSTPTAGERIEDAPIAPALRSRQRLIQTLVAAHNGSCVRFSTAEGAREQKARKRTANPPIPTDSKQQTTVEGHIRYDGSPRSKFRRGPSSSRDGRIRTGGLRVPNAAL
jgi:hypothetical protein